MSLEKVLSDLNKAYGKGSIGNLNDKPQEIGAISTGSIALDYSLGIGGFAKGRMIEIYGQESTSKTTLAINAVANVQKEGGKAMFIDMEHAFDPAYAEALGVNTDELLFAQPSDGEECLDMARKVAATGEVALIVIDSIAAMIPRAELQAEVGDSKMGLHARLMSQACRMITPELKKNNCTLIFINQLRDKIGVMFGSPEVTTGGNAVKFYCSQRIKLSRAQGSKDSEGTLTSITVTAKIEKNKVAPPFKKCKYDVVFGIGVDTIKEIKDYAVEMDIIKKSGSWFSYGDTKLGQGESGVREILEDNPELLAEIREKVLANLEK